MLTWKIFGQEDPIRSRCTSRFWGAFPLRWSKIVASHSGNKSFRCRQKGGADRRMICYLTGHKAVYRRLNPAKAAAECIVGKWLKVETRLGDARIMSINPQFLPEARPLEEWRQLLLVAANLVRARGLAKFRQLDDDGSMCIHGAISIAKTGKPYSDGAVQCAAVSAVRRQLHSLGVPKREVEYGLAPWNNQPERPASEVVAVLEAAAFH